MQGREVPPQVMATQSLRNAVLERRLPRIEPQTTVIHHPDAFGYQYSHHPHIVRYGGRFVVMWSSGIEREDRPGQRVLWSWSGNGSRWEPARALAEPQAGPWRLTAGGWAVEDGRLLAFVNRSRRAEDERLHTGTKWYPPLHLDVFAAREDSAWCGPQLIDSDFVTNESPRRTSSGAWLCAGSDARGTAAVLRSESGPAGPYTFHAFPRVQIPRPAGTAEQWTPPLRPLAEPTWYERNDGSIVALMRDDHASGTLFATTSTDDGVNWTTPEMTSIPDAKAKSAAIRLDDGRIVLFSNSVMAYRRKILTVLVSDDGRVFDRGAIIHEHPTGPEEAARGNAGWQYPSVVQDEGKLWLTFSDGKRDIYVTNFLLDALP